MLEALKKFENKAPEIVFHWSDSETEAEGWAVINSLRGGAAGGGTRMRVGLNLHEVISLAKTMEIKFSVCGPPIGGAKSGINFDPNDPRKAGVLKRWYKALLPLLKTYYGTGGDLNVDEIREVLPITREMGLLHCQEGVAVGHYQPDAKGKARIIKRLQEGVSLKLTDPRYTPDPSGSIALADMITGWGVTEAAIEFYKIWGMKPVGKRVIIQGFGNVGGAAAYYAAQAGMKVVGIIDRDGGVLNPDGFSFAEITHLLLAREGNKLIAENEIPYEKIDQLIWSCGAEVFLPCARSRVITTNHVETMLTNGLEVISCGANVPFDDPEIFLGETGIFADERCAVLPDFIANCGMARAFAYFMGTNGPLEDAAIFQDVTHTIHSALNRLHLYDHGRTHIAQNGLKMAINYEF